MVKADCDAKQNIRVFVRVRPSLPSESTSRSILQCTASNEVTVKDNVKGKISDRVTKTFRFNHVFNPQSSQVEVYQHVVEPLLEEVLQGYSCTVFAYGQTGTGKTFTMEGERSNDNSSWGSDPNAGIIPRTLSELFDRLRLMDAHYAVRISFLELYNEELIDLLSAPEDTTKLRLFEDSVKKGAVIISGLEEVEVCSKADVYSILEKGSLKRQTASTLMNAHSSRSHTVFTATVYIREKAENVEGQDVLRTGKINLVDLAGSENIGRSGAIDKRAREAGNINQSLLTLGRVITALVEQSSHVPYRESKLTRLLQESLGGRTKTSIIATVSPAQCNYEETLSTLEYAHRAKNIQNKPEINQRLSKKLHLAEYTEEIERLQRDLEATRQRTGVYLPQVEYDEMLRHLESLANETKEKVEQIKALSEEKLKHEALCDELSQKLQVVDADLQDNEAALATEKSALEQLEANLEKTRREEREQTHLVAKHWETAQKLKAQAAELRAVAEASSTKSVLLHEKLQRVRALAATNENRALEMQLQVARSIDSGLTLLDTAVEENVANIAALKADLQSRVHGQEQRLDGVQEEVKNLVNAHRESIDSYRKSTAEQDEQEASWAAKLKDITETGRQSSGALDSWHAQDLVPAVAKQCSQMEKLGTDITDLHSKAAEADSWCAEYKEALVAANSRVIAALIDDKLPVFAKELSEFDNVKANTAELAEKHGVYYKDVRQELSAVKALLGQTQALTRSWQETIDAKRADIASNVAKYAEGAAALRRDGDDFLTQGNAELRAIQELYTQRINNVYQDTCSAVNQWDASNCLGDLASSTKAVLEESRAAWRAHTDATVRLIEEGSRERKEANIIIDKRIQELRRLPEECNSKNSDGLDELNSSLSDLVLDVESRTSEYRDNVKAWTSSLENVATDCNERIHSFVFRDFQQYVPTGETPQRGNISYPRDLACTSPHERILGRFRQRNLHARLVAGDESLESSTESNSPVLPAVDTSSEIDESVKNKENSIKESPMKPAEKRTKIRKPLGVNQSL